MKHLASIAAMVGLMIGPSLASPSRAEQSAVVDAQAIRFGQPASAADGSWLDGDRGPWNVPGQAIPTVPTALTPVPDLCAPYVRPAETPEDAQVAAQGWRLYSASQRGWGIVLVGGFVAFDGMCRPVVYQQFVFVDGDFAGTLAPGTMLPRTDGALMDAGIATGDRVYAT